MFQLQEIKHVEEKKSALNPVRAITKREQGIHLSPTAQRVLQKSFVTLIVGRAGQGKSMMVRHLLLEPQILHQKYQRVLFIGPTQYDGLLQDQYNTHKVLDIEWIMKQIGECNKWQCKNLLLVFDDVAADFKDLKSSPLNTLFYNRRHLLTQGTISMIITTQKYTCIPLSIRGEINQVFIFPVSKQQVDTMGRQMDLPIHRNQFQQLVSRLKTGRFLFINFNLQKVFDYQWKQL